MVALPSYSPDLNPIEGLWKWMREEVTRNFCHASMCHLFDACKAFIDRINANPQRVVSRLWPRFEPTPAFEKFLVSRWIYFSAAQCFQERHIVKITGVSRPTLYHFIDSRGLQPFSGGEFTRESSWYPLFDNAALTYAQ